MMAPASASPAMTTGVTVVEPELSGVVSREIIREFGAMSMCYWLKTGIFLYLVQTEHLKV